MSVLVSYANVQETTQEGLDAKSELLTNRQSAYTSHDIVGTPSSSLFFPARNQATNTALEKAEELLRQAVKNSNVEAIKSSKLDTVPECSIEVAKSFIIEVKGKLDSTPATIDIINACPEKVNVTSERCFTSTSIIEIKDDLECNSESCETNMNNGDNSNVVQEPLSEIESRKRGGMKRDNSRLDYANCESTPERKMVKSTVRCGQCKCKLELAQRTIGKCKCDLQRLSNNLRILDLSDNKLAMIPASIGTFSLLKTINLNNNRIETLPKEIGNLKKLETLSLENNLLASLPSTLSNLSHLRTVNLSGNGFKTFPLELCSLKDLDAIDLSRNRITEVPTGASICHTIELNLNQNQISTLPGCIANWPRLKVLRLEENCLEISALTPKILKESQIALLVVEGNVFDMKQFSNLNGYDEYMARFTATKKKFS